MLRDQRIRDLLLNTIEVFRFLMNQNFFSSIEMKYRESINVTYVEGNHILLDMIRESRINACTFFHVTLLLKTINEEMKM